MHAFPEETGIFPTTTYYKFVVKPHSNKYSLTHSRFPSNIQLINNVEVEREQNNSANMMITLYDAERD
jgi:hypothetical protein